MELFNQPFSGTMGEKLISLLNSEKYTDLTIIVAFAKESGVLRIKDALDEFRLAKGRVTAYVGIDLDGTSYEALTTLNQSVDSLNIIHSETSQTFHPKIFNFVNDKDILTIVGSHNLTAGGLWTNFESSFIAAADLTQMDGKKLQQSIDDYVNELKILGNSFKHVKDQGFIEELLEDGYISQEVLQKINRKEARQNQSKLQPKFGAGKHIALPQKPSTRNPIQDPSQQEKNTAILTTPTLQISDHTLWYSTQKLTGGSGNQIDLSIQSKLVSGDPSGTPYDRNKAGYMCGTVEFFGVNPSQISQTKNITIHYQGDDYKGNTIKFPSNQHSNRTWRLQLEGVNASGKNLKSLYGNSSLKFKIITFTKLGTDYYSLAVFPGSELDNFKNNSDLCGYNGLNSNSRYIGIIY
ncbi:phospholipase D family protein [Rothia sp. HMSC071F11]|uniref:phospholipase D family protein n=1 Tax=Rothia sp. HMSC071F11 TaxID=1715034 RepID=UPI0008A27C83|nr:phospholipase D family protein [Rothia sp. HMSC071F11]OFN46042.1 hypothetical protein HMPREF2554_10400 [Rothia sp. HMSC071F11]